MDHPEKHIVPDSIEAIRLYDYCLGLFADLPSRKSVKKAIDKGYISVNGNASETGWWIKGGEIIEWNPPVLKGPKTYHLKLPVVFEDDFIALINKPAGLLVSGNQFKTVVNALGYNLKKATATDALPWPLPVHRLDQPTSGLVLIAKTKSARIELGNAFENRTVFKEYHAVVIGKPLDIGSISEPVDGKISHTDFELVSSSKSLKFTDLSLLKLMPKTGRKHQLRIHLKNLGYPILGDKLYGNSALNLNHKGLFLCATRLRFSHPITNESLDFQIETPLKFKKRMEIEKIRYNTYRAV